MSFRLHSDRPLPQEVRKAARSELKRLLTLIRQSGADVDEDIHQLRVGMKRIRALLRLVRDALGDEIYRAEQTWCKTLADSYSGSRDAAVGGALLDDLLDDCHDPEQRQRLRDGFNRALGHQTVPQPPLEMATERLQSIRARVDDWPLDAMRRKQLERRLKRQFRRGAGLNATVHDEDSALLMHEWRKIVKRLLYQLALVGGNKSDSVYRQLKALGSILGELHDLDVLDSRIEAMKGVFWLDDRLALHRLIAGRRRQKVTSAMKLGDKLFERKPKSFARARILRWQRRA